MSERRAFFREIAQAAMGARAPAEEAAAESVDLARHGRQVAVEGWGPGAQRRLGDRSALVVGAGALGAPVALHLTAAGAGAVGIVDPADVALDELHAQPLHFTPDAGTARVHAAAAKLRFLNPDVRVEPYQAPFASTMAEGYDVVVDATGRMDVPEADFAAWVAGPRGGVVGGACRRCAWPGGAPAGEPLGPAAGVVAGLLAWEVMRCLGALEPALAGDAIHVDLDGPGVTRDRVPALEGCARCAAVP